MAKTHGKSWYEVTCFAGKHGMYDQSRKVNLARVATPKTKKQSLMGCPQCRKG